VSQQVRQWAIGIVLCDKVGAAESRLPIALGAADEDDLARLVP
jgi:hypothetical protein